MWPNEAAIDRYNTELAPLREFILPAGVRPRHSFIWLAAFADGPSVEWLN